jgi:hypothetical protein
MEELEKVPKELKGIATL